MIPPGPIKAIVRLSLRSPSHLLSLPSHDDDDDDDDNDDDDDDDDDYDDDDGDDDDSDKQCHYAQCLTCCHYHPLHSHHHCHQDVMVKILTMKKFKMKTLSFEILTMKILKMTC